MADDPTKHGAQDGQRINLSQEREVAYWMKRLGVSREQLTEAVRSVGSTVAAVARRLNKSPKAKSD